jgi:hypothetical protein
VIERWTRLFHGPLLVQRRLAGETLTAAESATVKEIAAIWRNRLHDISWFMRCLNEHIARRANAEDECTGRFWEGRFKSRALLDEAALFSCMAYVDLNPIRAGMAKTLPGSDFTSVQDRLNKRASRDTNSAGAGSARLLSPFSGDNESRLSCACLPMRFEDYLALVAATGRSIGSHERGVMPLDARRALTHLAMDSQQWLALVFDIQTSSVQAIGALSRMRSYAKASGRCWVGGSGKMRVIYTAA